MIAAPGGDMASGRLRGGPGSARVAAVMKQGLVEWALVTAFLVLAAAGATALFGDEIRGAFGVGPAPAAMPRAAAGAAR